MLVIFTLRRQFKSVTLFVFRVTVGRKSSFTSIRSAKWDQKYFELSRPAVAFDQFEQVTKDRFVPVFRELFYFFDVTVEWISYNFVV